MKALRELDGTLQFRGLGGNRMLAEGLDMDYQLTDLAVVGFAEVLPKLREFFRVADIASNSFQTDRPDAVVLVDFPGFNWHIAKRAKQLGIPVFYYLPPQLWAWGSWRLRKMKRYVDYVLCNLPFEQTWYSERDMPCEFVGHPFYDEVAERKLDSHFLSKWSQSAGKKVAVLPGSRGHEVKNIWPMQVEAIKRLAAKHPDTQFLVACLKDQHCLWCRNHLSDNELHELPIEFFVQKTSEIIELSDCALAKSGSVSLELMARETPSVIVYHVSRSLNWIARRLTDLKTISLPNMIAGEAVMPEYIAVGKSTEPTIESATNDIDHLLSDTHYRQRQQLRLRKLGQEYALPGASKNAARAIFQQLSWPIDDKLRRAG